MDPSAVWSEGDQESLFSTINTYQATFISDILLYDSRNWNCDRTGRNVTERNDGTEQDANGQTCMLK